MAYGYPGMMGGFRGGDVEGPPSFLPQMQSMSDVIESIANKRMQIAQQERAEAHAQEKDAYYRGKVEAGERRQESDDRFKRAKMSQEELKRATGLIGRKLHPGVGTIQDDQGNPYTVEWRWVGGKMKQVAVPAEEAAPEQPAPDAAPQLTMPEMAPKPAPQGLTPPLRKPTFAGGPIPPTVARGSFNRLPPQQPDQMFLDEVDGEDARGIPETAGEPGKTVDLPMQAFPEGAREGQRFNAADVNMRGGYGNPFSGPLPSVNLRNPDQMFADEVSDGEARVIPETGGEPGKTMDLPQQALPEGAREGQRFNAADVNLKGGYGNPYAEPVPPQPAPPVERRPMPQGPLQLGQGPQAEVTAVPPTSTQGARYEQPPQQGGDEDGRWEATLPGGRVVAIRPGEAQAAAQAEREAFAQQVMASEDISPEQKRLVLSRLVVSGMDPKMGSQVAGQMGAQELEGQRQGGREKLEGIKAGNAKELEGLKQQGRIDLKKMVKGGKASLGGAKLPTGGGGEWISIPTNSKGIPQPNQLLKQVTTDWRSWAMDNDIRTRFRGLRRLALAQNNISAGGSHSGVLNIEAAFNYLGFVRGGVPVQNETKEMLDHRRTWGDRLHGLLARAEIAVPLQKFLKGESLTEQERNAAMNVMSPDEKKRIYEGIEESKAVMAIQVARSVQPFAERYANLDGPGAHILRQSAVSLMNSELKAIDLPHDYNPFTDTNTPKGSKYMRPSGGDSQQAAPAAPPPAAGSIGDLVRQLKPAGAK